MTDAEASEYAAANLVGYIEERVAAGERPEEARRLSEQQLETVFPGGRPAPGQRVYTVVDDGGAAVGSIWIGPRTSANADDYWVWNVEIAEDARGRGLGRAAMVLAEQEARGAGATSLGLNVFGANAVARGLYESLGYATTSLQMRKPL